MINPELSVWERLREEWGQSDIAYRGVENYTLKETADWWLAKLESELSAQEVRVREEIPDILEAHNARILNEFQLQLKPDVPMIAYDERIALIPAITEATKQTVATFKGEIDTDQNKHEHNNQ